MGMMMLYTYPWNIWNGEGVLSREIIWMKIVSQGLWFNIKKFLKMLNSFFKRGKGLQILKVSDMVTHKSILAAGQAKGVFQFPTAGQDHLKRKRKFNREGDITS